MLLRRLASRGTSLAYDAAESCGIKLRHEGRHILVACFPKSGSTFLSALLSRVTGFDNVYFMFVSGSNEQNLDPCAMRLFQYKNTVVQQHAKGTENNLKLIERHAVDVIVLTRNLADVVISVHDHVEREDSKSPTGYFHPEYFSMSRSDKLTFIIKMILPWYLHFLVSWRDASRSRPCFWLSYEDVFPDTLPALKQVLEFCRIDWVSDDRLADCIKSLAGSDTRLNVGQKGRGAELSPSQQEMMLDLARCWKVPPEIMHLVGLNI